MVVTDRSASVMIQMRAGAASRGGYYVPAAQLCQGWRAGLEEPRTEVHQLGPLCGLCSLPLVGGLHRGGPAREPCPAPGQGLPCGPVGLARRRPPPRTPRLTEMCYRAP